MILPATRLLGDLAEVRAVQPTESSAPVLGRALLYADRRVQMAAAEALLRVPGDRGGLTGSRIVDVLRRALAAEAGTVPKVVIGYTNDEFINKVAEALKQAGFEAVPVKTGRELLKRVTAAADIEAVIFDADLPDPGLVSLLGQLRGDIHVGRLPLFITPGHQQVDLIIAEIGRIDDQMKAAGRGFQATLRQRRALLDARLQAQSQDDVDALGASPGHTLAFISWRPRT